MASVLITGGSGFVGTHLAGVLVRREEDVTCLVRRTSRTEFIDPLPVTKAIGDVADIESLRRAVPGKRVVYHLAGCIRCVRTRTFFDVNEGGTRNLAQVCAEQPDPPVLVVVSSLAAVAPSPDGQPIGEDFPPAPVSNYGRSKLAGERAAIEFADRVPVTIVRPAGVFGETDRGCLEMYKPIDRFGVHVAPRGVALSMIHGTDLSELIVAAGEKGERINPAEADKDFAYGRYFASTEEYLMYDELGRMIGESLGRRRTRVLRVGRATTWFVASINEIISQIRRRAFPFNFDKAREATAGPWFCSPRKAMDQLGFAPGASLLERFRQTSQWYRKQGWL